MLKRLTKIMVFVIILMLLIWYQSTQQVDSINNIEKIEIFQVEGFTQINTIVFKTFIEKVQFQLITKAINTSNKIYGILDVVAPPYCLNLYYEDGRIEAYYLWVGKSGNRYNGMIMDVEDTHTGYTLKEESVKALLELIQ